jgi:multiple sugar transport system ATP-binding protein
VQVARPEEIYARPASVAVARLFGDPSINLSQVTPAVEQGRVTADMAGTQIRLDAEEGAAVIGQRCWLGVRPDDVVVTRQSGEGAIPARIVAVTPLHERAVVLLRFADDSEWLAALAPEALGAGADEEVFVRFAPEAALLFDHVTGDRIGPAPQRQAA